MENLKSNHKPARNTIDMTGKSYSRWTVISRCGTLDNKAAWLCRCDCGTERVVNGTTLRSGTSKSCGCLQREVVSKRNTQKRSAKPKCTKFLRELRIFYGMRDRCTNPNAQSSHRYYHRGIRFCVGMSTFAGFMATLGPSTSSKHSIDRIDNDGGYWCGSCDECVASKRVKNVRWATAKEQCRNTSSNSLHEIDGVTKCLTEWCEMYNASPDLVGERMCAGGWSIIDALTVPARGRHLARKITGDKKQEVLDRLAAGEPLTDELAAEYGVKRKSLFNIVYRAGKKMNLRPGPRSHETSVMQVEPENTP